MDTRWNTPLMIACPRSSLHNCHDARRFEIPDNSMARRPGQSFCSGQSSLRSGHHGSATPEDARVAFLAAADDAKLTYEFIAVATPSEPIQVIRSE